MDISSRKFSLIVGEEDLLIAVLLGRLQTALRVFFSK